ncbi:DUF4233 domain-containing protein [Antrihabitans cavernicola]|uniref:DUF4233 domain-containing protein n=1 Tax=Antrihabitans cavernicola TaxID=2495913 RepID=A0A5A7SBK5_9NOCA|nr:DUF4233 domain-containing protein [Spelaeibacter cavernicola]KAA0022934.1 DUF4233 domain-containing protein [Spelaeibacter cavernicola]
MSEYGEFKPPAKDPWKGFRGVCAGTLVLEAIVVLLALPVVATVGGGITWVSGTYIVALAVLMILGAGLQGRSWAIPFDVALQVAMIVGWVFHPAIGSLGILFSAVWAYIIYLRRDITDRLRQGLLPGQRD